MCILCCTCWLISKPVPRIQGILDVLWTCTDRVHSILILLTWDDNSCTHASPVNAAYEWDLPKESEFSISTLEPGTTYADQHTVPKANDALLPPNTFAAPNTLIIKTQPWYQHILNVVPAHVQETLLGTSKTWKHWTHLAEVPDIKQVKGVEQLAVAKAKLVMAHLKECPDVLQTQELEKRGDKGWH